MPENTLKEILTSNIISVSPNTSISKALFIMAKKKISCILVVKDKKPVGIFTERDVVRSLHIGAHLKTSKINELMSKPVISANLDMNIYSAYDLLEKHKVRHLVVVDSKGEIAGVVTHADIINSLGIDYFIDIKEISRIMTKNVVTVKKESLVQEAIDKMSNFSISCIVVEENNSPVGILTERDVTYLFQKKKDIGNLKIEEVMSHPIRTVSMNTSVYDAVNIMKEKKIRRLVIVDEKGIIAGLITQSDIARKLEVEYIEYLKTIIHKRDKMLDEIKNILGEKLTFEQIKRQKLESLGILVSGIAHDFNNILTTILGNITLAKISTKFEEKRLKILNEIEKSIIKAKNLSQQLFTVSKGGSPAVKKVVSISKLLKESAEFILRGSNIICKFSIPDTLWQVECDEGQINQVIDNIIINAKESMPEGGIVEVKAKNMSVTTKQTIPLQKGKYIKISIKDHGCGISKEYLSKIFDPYVTTKPKGSGLGLTTASSIVKRHNGYIDVESKLGMGTTFHIYLPVYLPTSKKKIRIKENETDKILKGEGNILLMDDDDDLRRVTIKILEYLGYEVTVAKDGNEAIEKYKKAKNSNHPFDVVILDLIVHDKMGGKEAIQKLISFDPKVKAIAMTGYSNDPIMSDFRKYGFSDVIAKPFEVKELNQTIHKVKHS